MTKIRIIDHHEIRTVELEEPLPAVLVQHEGIPCFDGSTNLSETTLRCYEYLLTERICSMPGTTIQAMERVYVAFGLPAWVIGDVVEKRLTALFAAEGSEVDRS